MSNYDVFSTNSLDNHGFRENFKYQCPSKFEWDRRSSTTDAGYGSYCGSSFSLATSRYSTEEDNRMDKISLAPSMTSYHTARPYCPDPLPAVETKYQISPSTEVGSCALNYHMSIVNEESYNRGLYDVKRNCERFDYYPEATRDDNYHVYTGKCKDDRLPYQPAIERSYWRLGPSVNSVGDGYSNFNIPATVDTKCDKVSENERRTTKEFYKEEAILEMERRQRSYRFWQSVHAEVKRKEEKKIRKKEEKEKKIADKKMKKENGTKGPVSNFFKTLKKKFSVNQKDSGNVSLQTAKTGQQNSDSRAPGKKETGKEITQSKRPTEKSPKSEQPLRKKSRPEQSSLETIEEENEEAGTLYDGHPSLREIHGTTKTASDEELGIQSAFLLDGVDVSSSELPGTKLTTQAVFRYLYWRVGKHNTETPEQRCALLHPAATTRNDAYALSESLSDNICYKNYQGAKPDVLIAPVYERDHFALSIFKKEESGNVRVVVLDSMVGSEKMMTQDKAERIAKSYFETKRSSRVIREHATQKEAQIQEMGSNDCGVITIHNVERFLKHRETPMHNMLKELQSDFEIIDTSVSRRAYGSQLTKLIAEDAINNEFDENQDVQGPLQENSQKNKEDTNSENLLVKDVTRPSAEKRNYNRFEKSRRNRQTAMKTARELRNASMPPGRPSVVGKTDESVRSHKKKSSLGMDGKLDEGKSQPNSVLVETILNVPENAISQLTQREQTKLMQRIQNIVETTAKTKNPNLSSPSISSVDSPIYSPRKNRRNHVQKELTFDQKKLLVKLYSEDKTPIERLISRFNLCPDVKSARVQIMRISKEVEIKTPNRLQAWRLLRNRVQSMIEHKDEDLKEDIHGADIQRAAIEQSVVFGLPNFRASSKWLHGMKKQLNLTSRHVDTRVSKVPSNGKDDLEETIDDFIKNVVPEIKRKYAPDHIYNVDQTGLQYELKINRTLTKKAAKKCNESFNGKML